MANMPVKKVEEKPKVKNADELTSAIIQFITNDINTRSGIGTIWRQLNTSRREEMLKKWKHGVGEILK